MSKQRPCLDLGLPLNHVTLLDCYWKEHPQAARTLDLIEQINQFDKPMYGVTGASGSGKDSFVEGAPVSWHCRFGDIMKDMAYCYGMTPYGRKYYEQNREARNEILTCGKTALDAWIALDVIREYNPFVFIEQSLQNIVEHVLMSPLPIVFSGMRTELGLEVVRELSDSMYRVERKGHKPPINATLDELQVLYPVDAVIPNDGTFLELQMQSKLFLV